MSATLTATAALGTFVATTSASELSPDVATKAAICLLDSLGLALAARHEPTAAAARAMAAEVLPGPRTARIWASGKHAALSEAVLANGIAVHAHFQDDTDHDSWTHPGSLIAPVAVALGEALDAPLRTVLTALTVGYSALKWLGAGEVVARGLIGRGVRTSPTFGTIGAAAAAAAALGLDPPRSTSAVAIAACTTGGTLEPVRCGSDEWRVQNGRAAQGGLVAAELAARGVQGAPDALEGPKGLLRSLAGLDHTPEQWQRGPDVATMIGIMAKPFATLGDNMSAVLAAHMLHRDGIDLSQVKRITVTIWEPYTQYPGTSFKGPFTRTVQTQASTAFAVAAMLRYGRLDYEMGVEHRQDREIMTLVEKTIVEPDAIGTHLDATVELEIENGGRLRRTAREAPKVLVFQDEVRATEVFDSRLAGTGIPAGEGASLAAEVFASARSGGSMPVRRLLDRLTRSQRDAIK
ncbi:2-methylcitrate dehydratase PrpD [Bradyrhizobium japonicum]|jgi:2-methylcitrate dehydratase PrpD|uniref:2-methylcitrate dehydratase PrpD n=2 Tax=Bradyrhizobium elkanii TaxID=29448 RepID=A0ABV4FA35_BRAEL|nr:MmgE/PrpD family protein [Bradyrhizobium elkanii]MBP2432616.1 2-methylcitrate dehydratase PrpD [Bradyrhizobium elkanii]MCP1734068.1 2-methylcitrate dehydratase PrpD [Bradyrhizobium elkanii]MCP1751751.1 2-methylcitrate dehydratase PrpD [Bradyrhizobium elkanii]MCP1966958.1 2-methylcitrate dehydratase PrpD [Bradyrhizobium elkanii]MCP1977522.1 2-methylcitrate dehydratase PrpD [Bradyrhizobium elkanii]